MEKEYRITEYYGTYHIQTKITVTPSFLAFWLEVKYEWHYCTKRGNPSGEWEESAQFSSFHDAATQVEKIKINNKKYENGAIIHSEWDKIPM